MRDRIGLPSLLMVLQMVAMSHAQESQVEKPSWQVGTPIVTYYAGPPLSEALVRQMADGGFNVVWCAEADLDLVQRYGLRGMLRDGLLSPATLDSTEQRSKLDALIGRVRQHPALYSYYVTDEPNAAAFPGLGKLVAYLRQKDPERMAYINLFPTYANNQQLGNQGNTETAYREHLRQYIEIVKPQLISYDHYAFNVNGDGTQYFLNLQMIRESSLAADVPFLNIVQASSWAPSVRVPVANEMRYLVYTTLGYGARGISYYVYSAPGHQGGMLNEDGSPTAIYEAVKPLNHEFVAIATQLESLRSLAVYHTVMTERGCQPLPAEAPFQPEAVEPANNSRGLMLGYFGTQKTPTHVLVVNLDYRTEATCKLVGPNKLETFDGTTREWSATNESRVDLRLSPGGGQLLRMAQSAR